MNGIIVNLFGNAGIATNFNPQVILFQNIDNGESSRTRATGPPVHAHFISQLIMCQIGRSIPSSVRLTLLLEQPAGLQVRNM